MERAEEYLHGTDTSEEKAMGPEVRFYQAENEYRRQQLHDVRRANAVRKAIRLRALLQAQRAEQTARETLVRVA